MYSQVDSIGHHTLLLKEITDHRKLEMAVPIDDNFFFPRLVVKVLGRLPRDRISSVYGKMAVQRGPH